MNDHKKAFEAELSDAGLAGNIIAEAFADDPVNLWMFGSPQPMEPTYFRLAKFTYLARGFGHIVGDRSDGARGAALWLPPGGTNHTSLVETLSLGAALLRYGGPRAISRSLAVQKGMASHDPEEPHYYLFAIGVRPEFQGQGYGSALFRPALERCDSEHMPAYLESSKERNIPIYQAHGFEVTGTITPAKGAPPFWLMWREPR